jgi:hypothetical protein
MMEKLTEIVLKFYEEVSYLLKDNEILKMKTGSISEIERPYVTYMQDSLTCRDMTSSVDPKNTELKTFNDACQLAVYR